MKAVLFLSLLFLSIQTHAESSDIYWMKIRAQDKYQRTAISNAGALIEYIEDDYVIAYGSKSALSKIRSLGVLEESFIFQPPPNHDFPNADAPYHNYKELLTELQNLATQHPKIVKYEVIGKSFEDREIVNLRISTDVENASSKPGISFMGGHHAREHLSIEVPLMLAQYLVDEYEKGTPQIVTLLQTREINILPMVNPDGAEYDISTGNYKYWRKNRHPGQYSVGVDLNRNYGYMWGAGGASNDEADETYLGTAPFSEPETRAIRDFIDGKPNITITLSFHTFSQLILYPWGYTYDSIANSQDMKVHQTMANTMAQWNGYKAEQSSALYIAAGDTTDWAYGTHKIISFTFELDPKDSIFSEGFYPGKGQIPVTFQKNLKPSLYLIEYADNPYRVLQTPSAALGFKTNILN